MTAHVLQTADRTVARISHASLPLVLDVSGALYMPSERMLVVADLHLEKATSGALRGVFLPPYDSKITLDLLMRTVEKFDPLKVVFLGDSFHDAHAPFRLDENCLSILQTLSCRCEVIWITGNHDPHIPQSIAASCSHAVHVAGMALTHIPQVQDEGPHVSGHLHPVVTVTGRGRTLRRRCFVSDGNRMILPAFGAFTGGLNIKDKAFDGLFQRNQLMSYVIGDEAIYPLPVTTKRS